MATTLFARYISRRLSINGKVLSKDKAAGNIYIKKMEQEKLDKLAQELQKMEQKKLDKLAREKVLNNLQKMEQEKLDKVAGKGPPKASPGQPSGSPDIIEWLRGCVYGGTLLVYAGASVVWENNLHVSTGIVCAGLGADLVLQSKSKTATAAVVVSLLTGMEAYCYLLRYLFSKENTEQVLQEE